MENKNLKTVRLKNGVEVPILGFGTSTTTKQQLINEKEFCKEAVKYALKIGYRHIDTAECYKNEDIVGEAIKESGVDRQEIFITTKVDAPNLGRERARKDFMRSIEKLGVDFVDLYLIHAPSDPEIPISLEEARRLRLETWLTLIDLYNEEKCRAIGVSNYSPRHIQEIIDANLMLPMINQWEFHPYYTNQENFDFCLKNDIVFEGYCPLARGAILNDETVLRLAEKYSKTPAQIAIRWSIQKNVITIPGSWSHARIKENFEVQDFMLEESDMKLLSSLNKNFKAAFDPTNFI